MEAEIPLTVETAQDGCGGEPCAAGKPASAPEPAASRRQRESARKGRPPNDDSDLREELTELTQQLRAKEELVAALTARLEQAAEQLDRLRRTGNDRVVRGTGGLPAELIDEQKALTGELQRAVEQWEDMQAAATLGRLEIQISELRDLIAGQVAGGSPQPVASRFGIGSEARKSCRTASQKPPENSQQGEPDGGQSLKAGDAGLNRQAGWAGPPTAAEILSQEDACTSAGDDEPHAGEPSHGDAPTFGDVKPPAAIDFFSADAGQLCKAIEDRDVYIAHLLRQLRASKAVVKMPTDWNALNNTPADLQARLQQLEKQLDDQLRVAEVELSLERARLGREAVKLHQLEDQVQKNMRLLGLNPNDGSAPQQAEVATASPDTGGKRWLRMLGLGNAESD